MLGFLCSTIRILRRLAPYGALLLMLALIMRYLWRDEFTWSAPTFYALPLPLHIAGWLILGSLWWKPARRLSWMCAAGVVFSAVLWWMNTTRLRGESAAGDGDGPRVLWWNIGHTHKVPAALHELIRELKPDVIGLAEAENLGAGGFGELKKEHPGYQHAEFNQGVACLVLGSFPAPASRELAPRVTVNVATLTLTRLPGEWKLCLTDIPPAPPFPRTEYLDDIRRLAGNGPRTIIAADFNTPLDSAGFDAWREEYHHGLADCTGWRGPLETWGFGIPVLSIDHIWMSRDFSPRTARKEARLFQDHSWLFVEWAPSQR